MPTREAAVSYGRLPAPVRGDPRRQAPVSAAPTGPSTTADQVVLAPTEPSDTATALRDLLLHASAKSPSTDR